MQPFAMTGGFGVGSTPRPAIPLRRTPAATGLHLSKGNVPVNLKTPGAIRLTVKIFHEPSGEKQTSDAG
jgi:hypothetical protein